VLCATALAGLGQAEATSLTWDDVSFEKGRIITFWHKTTAGFVSYPFSISYGLCLKSVSPWLKPQMGATHRCWAPFRFAQKSRKCPKNRKYLQNGKGY
jgi:integrase